MEKDKKIKPQCCNSSTIPENCPGRQYLRMATRKQKRPGRQLMILKKVATWSFMLTNVGRALFAAFKAVTQDNILS